MPVFLLGLQKYKAILDLPNFFAFISQLAYFVFELYFIRIMSVLFAFFFGGYLSAIVG
jgi:hypothetical protein